MSSWSIYRLTTYLFRKVGLHRNSNNKNTMCVIRYRDTDMVFFRYFYKEWCRYKILNHLNHHHLKLSLHETFE